MQELSTMLIIFKFRYTENMHCDHCKKTPGFQYSYAKRIRATEAAEQPHRPSY